MRNIGQSIARRFHQAWCAAFGHRPTTTTHFRSVLNTGDFQEGQETRCQRCKAILQPLHWTTRPFIPGRAYTIVYADDQPSRKLGSGYSTGWIPGPLLDPPATQENQP